MKPKPPMKRAWLITWGGTPHTIGNKERVVAILDSRISSERVRDYVELIYASAEYSLMERVLYAKKRFNPYPARYLPIEGVPWRGLIGCGSNPWLEARHVANVQVVVDSNGDERLQWDEITAEEIHKIKELHKRLNLSTSSHAD